ncbi:uncharacterized protein LOC119840773 [Zerene cesonia]|uniref:uncharacterized protein LOC119840773 n=1 Tax=Zerene cesonia TaxID=33412 RepID=UPI0018E5880B|nr:uncharacterized protein LOC119840773 [Zerene cesonia]
MEKRSEVSLEDFPPNIQISLNEIVKKEGYIKYDVNVNNISTNGNNFLGELYELKITGESVNGYKEINIFLKQIINNDDFKVYSIRDVYAKEAFFYNELVDIFSDVQNNSNVPIEERLKVVRSYKETSPTTIILENMVMKGYKPGNRFDLLTRDFAEMSIKELAKFHALSFVLQKKRPEYFDKKIRTIKQSFVYDEYWDELVKKMCEISISNLSVDKKERVRQFIPVSLAKYPLYMTGATACVRCLVHGDFKTNNIMRKDENGILTEVIPIDYQQIYYGNPIIDLIYFIYAASDRPFRKANLHRLKDFYYEALGTFLKHFHIEVESVFPRASFEDSFNESLDYGLMFALYMYPFLFAGEDDSPSGSDDLSDVLITVDDRLYERMEGVVDDFIELGVI